MEGPGLGSGTPGSNRFVGCRWDRGLAPVEPHLNVWRFQLKPRIQGSRWSWAECFCRTGFLPCRCGPLSPGSGRGVGISGGCRASWEALPFCPALLAFIGRAKRSAGVPATLGLSTIGRVAM